MALPEGEPRHADEEDQSARLVRWLNALPDSSGVPVMPEDGQISRKSSSFLRTATPVRSALRSVSSFSTLPSSAFVRPEDKPGYKRYLDYARSDYPWSQLEEFEAQQRQGASSSSGVPAQGTSPEQPDSPVFAAGRHNPWHPVSVSDIFMQPLPGEVSSDILNQAIDLHKLQVLLAPGAARNCVLYANSVLERHNVECAKAARGFLSKLFRQMALVANSESSAEEFWDCFRKVDEAIDPDHLCRLEAANLNLERYLDSVRQGAPQAGIDQALASIGAALDQTNAPLLTMARDKYYAVMQARRYDLANNTETAEPRLRQLEAVLDNGTLKRLAEARSYLDRFLEIWRQTFISGTGMQHAAVHQFVKRATAYSGLANLSPERFPVMRLLEEAEKSYPLREDRTPKLNARLKTAIAIGPTPLKALAEMHIWKFLLIERERGTLFSR
jgi:hypothetical protein